MLLESTLVVVVVVVVVEVGGVELVIAVVGVTVIEVVGLLVVLVDVRLVVVELVVVVGFKASSCDKYIRHCFSTYVSFQNAETFTNVFTKMSFSEGCTSANSLLLHLCGLHL